MAVALVVFAAALVLPASPAFAAVVLSADSTAPGSITVGDTGVPATIHVANNSTGAQAAGTVTLSQIALWPTCGAQVLAPCTAPDTGVVALSATGSGIAGSACAGQTFTISAPDPTGRVLFTPANQVVLALGAKCEISYTFSVLKMPTLDSNPGPGIQTTEIGIVGGTHIGTGATGTSTFFFTKTAFRDNPTLSTQASPSVPQGGTIFATATLAGGTSPTGTIDFSLYPPADVNCLGAAAFTNSKPVTGNGSYQSAGFVANIVGTWRWTSQYQGDANNFATPRTPCAAPSAAVVVTAPPPPGGRYRPLTPARILDTRDGTGGITGPIGPGATVDVQITGQGGVPASGVSAVAVNVTVTGPTGTGFITLFPAGTARPLAANINFTPGKTVANLAVVKLGTGGKVSLYNSTGNTQVIFDVAGWYEDPSAGNAGRYVGVVPARILDTRNGTGGGVRLGPGASLNLQVSGQGGLPASGVSAAVFNAAVTGTTATSFLTIYPTGQPRPLAANLNFNVGNTVSNRAMVKLGTGGQVTIYNNAGSTDVIVDVNGWYTDASVAGSTGIYTPLTPARILDTRNGTGGITGPIAGNTSVDVQVSGAGGVPASGVSAVILNATVVSPAGPGYLTISPTGTAMPLSADLNYATGETRANLVVVKLGTAGKVNLFTSAGSHVVFDVAGWFS